MINLDARYQSYLHGSKKLRIDGVEETVRAYGYSDDGKGAIDGYYLTTDNYTLYYDNDEIFLKMEAREKVKVT